MFGGSPVQLTPIGFGTVTVSTSAIGLPSIPTSGQRATKALITIETNPVRWRDDGTNPTAGAGQPIAAAGVLEYEGVMEAFKVIRSGASDATLNVTYYR